MDAEREQPNSVGEMPDPIALLEADIKKIDETMKDTRRKRNSEIHKKYLEYERFKKSSMREIEGMEKKKLRLRDAIDILEGRKSLPGREKEKEKEKKEKEKKENDGEERKE